MLNKACTKIFLELVLQPEWRKLIFLGQVTCICVFKVAAICRSNYCAFNQYSKLKRPVNM